MRVRLPAVVLVILMTGCASQPVHSKTSSNPTPQTDTHSVPRRVTLPYTFMRSGVEIRVTSIEFADSKVVVNISLQETRGQAVKLSALTLMQTFSSDGKELAYSHYSRAGEIRQDTEIHVNAHDQFSISLFYQPSSASAGTAGESFRLQFPTGKYWSSQAAE
jgi:hypothetical protein